MATSRTAIKISVDQIVQMADAVGALDAQALGAAALTALNEVVDKTYDLSRERITTGINLSDDYLRRRMEVEHATGKKLEASITATGDRSQMTRLAKYNAAMVIVPRTSTRKSRSKGLLPLNGGKQAGVTVTVSKGQPKTLSDNYFILRLANHGADEKFGVFSRGKGKTQDSALKHHYGPSVYQLFRYQAGQIIDEVADDLQQTLLDRVGEQVDKVLK